jgi:hypothetical protein
MSRPSPFRVGDALSLLTGTVDPLNAARLRSEASLHRTGESSVTSAPRFALPARGQDSGDMKRISYASTSVLVGDDFGTLLLEYAAALARNGTSETIMFRGIGDEDSRELEVSFIVGPASEIVVERLSDQGVASEPDNADIMAALQRRIAELTKEEDRKSTRAVIPEPAAEERTLIDGLDI